MRSCGGLPSKLLSFVLVVALVGPYPVWSATAPLGTARGFGAAKVSIDDSKSWVPIGTGSRSFPIVERAEVRSSSGSAVLELADGSRVNLLPFSAVRFQGTSQTPLWSQPPSDSAVLYRRPSGEGRGMSGSSKGL
jgi:hypothetical protein